MKEKFEDEYYEPINTKKFSIFSKQKITLLDSVDNYVSSIMNNNEVKHLRWISGKWFTSDDIEIKNIRKYLSVCRRNNPKCFAIRNESDYNNWQSEFIAQMGEEDFWPEMPIVKEVKRLEAEGAPLNDLPFALDDKQLKIINVLLFKPLEPVFFITTGIGGSGKSTFGNIVQQLFNNDVGYHNLSDLSNDFNVAEAIEHRLIYSDELAKGKLNLPIIKILANKQKMNVAKKFQNSHTVQTQSSLLFNCNKTPKIDITDTGILRRIIYYSRNIKIKNPDLTLEKKVFGPCDLITIARHAYRQDMTNWRKYFEEETHLEIAKSCNIYFTGCYDNYAVYVENCKLVGETPYKKQNWEEIVELFKEWGLTDNV